MIETNEPDVLTVRTALVVAEINHLLWRDRVVATAAGIPSTVKAREKSDGRSHCDMQALIDAELSEMRESAVFDQLCSAHRELHAAIRKLFWMSGGSHDVQGNLEMVDVKVAALSYALEVWNEGRSMDLVAVRAGLVTCCLTESAGAVFS